MQHEFLNLLATRKGHFRYESSYHSDLWLDLDRLFLRPRAVQPFAMELAKILTPYNVTAVCGSLVGGAFLAQMVAAELDVEFFYTERFVRPQQEGLYPIAYRLPDGLHQAIRGKDIAILDDVISAGSAVRGTLTDLRAYGIGSVVVGALLVLGDSAPKFFAKQNIPLVYVAEHASNLWLPSDCPLCAAQVPLEDLSHG